MAGTLGCTIDLPPTHSIRSSRFLALSFFFFSLSLGLFQLLSVGGRTCSASACVERRSLCGWVACGSVDGVDWRGVVFYGALAHLASLSPRPLFLEYEKRETREYWQSRPRSSQETTLNRKTPAGMHIVDQPRDSHPSTPYAPSLFSLLLSSLKPFMLHKPYKYSCAFRCSNCPTGGPMPLSRPGLDPCEFYGRPHGNTS